MGITTLHHKKNKVVTKHLKELQTWTDSWGK
jgi:hypothetical protein